MSQESAFFKDANAKADVVRKQLDNPMIKEKLAGMKKVIAVCTFLFPFVFFFPIVFFCR